MKNRKRFCCFHRRLLPWLFFLPVVIAIFSPWWYQGKVLAPLDIVTNLYEPWANPDQPVEVNNHFATDAPEQYLLYHHHASQSFHEEGRFGWNFFKHGGTPAYLNTMAIPGDWSIHLHRFLPFWTAWHLGIMGQMLIAMFGMYFLLRNFKVSRGLCILGGLAFGLNNHFFAWLYHRWTLGAFCWTPWWLWAFERLKQNKRSGLLTPLFLALSLMGGHLQFAAFQVIILGLVCLVWTLEERAQNRAIHKPLIYVILIGLVGFGLSFFILLPSTYGFIETISAGRLKGKGLGYPEGFTGMILNGVSYIFYLFPFPLGSVKTLDLFKLFNSHLMYVPFFSSLLIVFGIIGLFKRKIPGNARLLALAGLLLPMTPLLSPFYQRMLILWIIGGIWISIITIHRLKYSYILLIRQWLLRIFIVLTLFMLVIGSGIRFQQQRITNEMVKKVVNKSQTHRFSSRPEWFAERSTRFVKESIPWHPGILIPWLLFGGSIFMLRYRQRPWFGYALILLVAPQIWLYSKQWVTFTEPFGKERGIFPETVETKALSRIVGSTGRVHYTTLHKNNLPLFPPNSLNYFGIPMLSGYDSIVPSGTKRRIHSATNLTQELGKFGVTHTVTFREEDHPGFGWDFVENVGRISIYSNLYSNPWYSVMTENGIQSAKIELHQHNRRKIHVPPGSRQLKILENWNEGWRYRINGAAWKRIQKTGKYPMTIPIPKNPTSSVIEMDFSPRLKTVSAAVSVCIGILFLCIIPSLWKRFSNQQPGNPS